MTPPRFDALLVTCEHATNYVPPEHAAKFESNDAVLTTHRAWDPGAADLARDLETALKAPTFYGDFTRLLADLNRRETAPRVFSEFTPAAPRPALLELHRAWRSRVLAAARKLLGNGKLLHVSCHSFTPELNGEVRNAEVGLLYDPRRKLEKRTADTWHAQLSTALPGKRIRRNYPYRGTSDGVTTWLRRELGANYAGFEIELNQIFSARPAPQWADVRRAIIAAVARSLKS